MQLHLSKWLTVFILAVSTLNRPTTAKRNILDDLLFMGLNQLDKDGYSRLDLTPLKKGTLVNDLMRVFDHKPREVTGLDLPINPMPFNKVQVYKLLYTLTPFDMDSIVEQTQAVNTAIPAYDIISYFIHEYGVAVIENIGNVSRLFPGLNVNTTIASIPKQKTKAKPKQTITEMVIGTGVDALFSGIGKYFSKSKESSNKTLSYPTTQPKGTSKINEKTASNVAAEKDSQAAHDHHHSFGASDESAHEGSAKTIKTETKIKDTAKQKGTQNATKTKGLSSFLNLFKKPKLQDTKTSQPNKAPTRWTSTEVSKETNSLTTPDTAMIPEFHPGDAMIPDYEPHNIVFTEMTTEFPLNLDSELDALKQPVKNN